MSFAPTDNEVLGKFTGDVEQPSLDQLIRDMPRRGQVARIIGFCEGIANSGILGADLEAKLRKEIAATLVVFDMPAKTDSFEQDLNAIREVMEQKT